MRILNQRDSENYRNCVIKSAPDWTKGLQPISNTSELVIIADHYNISLPRYVSNFVSSQNPNELVATGSWKGLIKLLKRLETRIIEKEG